MNKIGSKRGRIKSMKIKHLSEAIMTTWETSSDDESDDTNIDEIALTTVEDSDLEVDDNTEGEPWMKHVAELSPPQKSQ
ncbi:hypothetical protein HAX54_015542 [Datura stramonium]|uniref:Uncharacterized protein n=1 Tax=Datura stramonium TaxID=4076 RepID=A0ABS8Y5B9_DATST|nr:hypothetical protein [Datura stramonium]